MAGNIPANAAVKKTIEPTAQPIAALPGAQEEWHVRARAELYGGLGVYVMFFRETTHTAAGGAETSTWQQFDGEKMLNLPDGEEPRLTAVHLTPEIAKRLVNDLWAAGIYPDGASSEYPLLVKAKDDHIENLNSILRTLQQRL